ncbi:MAG: superoxide dismutase, Ni [Acidimicrobiia bacterium]|nr:superoxide dismutase, Ni [Acidimicrobiia bacterium]
MFKPKMIAHAHCDLYCGVYDPAQAKIEAMSVWKSAQKYQGSEDPVFRKRAIFIKEQQAELVKHHLSVLWTDFFTADHRAEFPVLDDLFWRAIHQAGVAKKSMDPAEGEKLVGLIDEIAGIFWSTEKAQGMGVYPPS